MLVLTRRLGVAIILSPSNDIDLKIAVGEVFTRGAFSIELLAMGA